MSTNRFRFGGIAGAVTALVGKGTLGDPSGQGSELSQSFNLVFLNYCSSDQWVGDQATTVDLNNGVNDYALYFQGHRILQAMIDRLMTPVGTVASDGQSVPSLANASQIILSGDSAGGGGMVNNALWVFEELQAQGVAIAAEDFITVVDAGNDRPFEADGFDALVNFVQDEYETVRSHPDVWNWFGGNSDCAIYHANEGANSPYGLWACGYSNHLIANHWRFPTLLREDLRDPANGDQTLIWAQDTIENFVVQQSAVSQGARLIDSRHPAGEFGNLWFLGQWLGAPDTGYGQAAPEIPADLKNPPEEGFTGIPEESGPPVLATFAPNCALHDASVSNVGFFRHKIRTAQTWWHGGQFGSLHDLLVAFANEQDVLSFEGDIWDWNTHDPRTWLDDTYGGGSDCDGDGVVASEDCHDGDASRQFDCDGDLLFATGASPDCDDLDPGVGVEIDCDTDGEGSLDLAAGMDCNDMDADVGSPALLVAGSEDFIRADGRNACFDLEDNDCDGLVDCDESECQYGCARLATPVRVPSLLPGRLAWTTLVLLVTGLAIARRKNKPGFRKLRR